MTKEEREAKIVEVEQRAEAFAATPACNWEGAKLVEDMAWLVGQIAEVREEVIADAVAVVDGCREEGESDLRSVRGRIRGL